MCGSHKGEYQDVLSFSLPFTLNGFNFLCVSRIPFSMKSSVDFQDAFKLLGNSFTFDANLFSNLESFFCQLYGLNCTNANQKAPETQRLPPTRYARVKVVNITEVMIKLQFKLPQALISRGFTRRTVFHAPAFQQKGINRLMDIYQISMPCYTLIIN